MNNYCIYCGNRLKKNDSICSACGQKTSKNDRNKNQKTKIAKTIITILTIAISVIIIFMLFSINTKNKNSIYYINYNWGTSFPYCDEKLYHIDDGDNIFGDGDRYRILKYDDSEKIKKLNAMQWDETLTPENKKMLDLSLERWNVPKNKRINYNKNLLYMVKYREDNPSDIMIIAYDQENNQLHIFERVI